MTRAFGDEVRFGVNSDPSEVEGLLAGSHRSSYTTYLDQFKAKDFVPDGRVLYA